MNPVIEPDPAQVLHEITLERAAVSTRSAAVGEAIEALHAEPGRRVWLCGAYAARGVPLLETGVVSGNAIAQRILSAPAPSIR